jgi:RNA-splicing ligase RtcB
MSRTAAKDEYSATEFDEETDGVFMSETPLDEIPSAYKDSAEVEQALGESVEVVDRIEPVLSIKAD